MRLFWFIWGLGFLFGLATAQAQKKQPQLPLDTGGERTLGVVYKTIGAREMKMDVYHPLEKPDAPCPVVVYTHGGGWAAGSRFGAAKGSFAPLFKQLVKDGFAVVSVSYRLCKKESGVRMRDCVIDSKDAVRYVAKHHATLGIDREQMFVFGDSAGGHIAQMLTLSPSTSLTGDPELAKVEYQIRAGLSWYGPCDFENMNLFNHDDRPGFRDRFGPRITGPDPTPDEKVRLYREMSPVTYLKKDSPPLFMIQGDQDTTIPVKHARHMEQRARELHAPVTTLIVKNAGHNWRKVGADIEPTRTDILEASVRFFHRHRKRAE